MSELTTDYPVQGYTKKSGTKVKTHERNPLGKLKGKLQKEIILLKAKKIKELILSEDEYAVAHFGRLTSYPTYQEYLGKEKKRLGLDLIPVISREDSAQECVSNLMSEKYDKWKSEGLTREQMLGKAFGICREKKDLTEDYPVQGHTRVGKPVRAHTRGEGKTPQEKGYESAKQKYPNEDVYVTKSGNVYIAVAEGGGRWSPINRTTQKAIKVSGYGWVPKKASFTKGDDPRYEKVYVASWFFDKNPNINKKLTNEKLYRLEKEIKSFEESIRSLPSQAHLSEKDIVNATAYFKKEIQRIKKEIEEEKELSKTDFILIPVITSVIKRTDSIPFSEFKELKTDLINSDFVIFHGPIARDGPYDYMDEETGKITTLYKDIDNLKDIYSRYNYLPMRTSEIPGAHYAEEFGYATNFSVNEKTNEIEADLILVNDEKFKKILNKKDLYHVSPGYNDIVTGNIQMVTDVDHIALTLGKEIGRACTGTNSKGASCTKVKKVHDQNLTEVVSN